MIQTKLIKRYANRRLYDAESSRTITLEEVAECIRTGRDVRVVDNLTGDDITTQVLAQTFLKISTEQSQGEFGTFLLTSLIRDMHGNVAGFFQKMVDGGIGSGALTAARIEQIVQSLVERGHLEGEQKTDYVEMVLRQREEYRQRMEERVEAGIGFLKEEFSAPQGHKIEELSSKLNEMARIIQEMQKL